MEVAIRQRHFDSQPSACSFVPLPRAETPADMDTTIVTVPEGWTFVPFGHNGVLLSKTNPPTTLDAHEILTLARQQQRGFSIKSRVSTAPAADTP